MQRRRLPRGVEAEADADERADGEACEGPAVGENEGEVHPEGDAVASGNPHEDAYQAADLGEHDGLEEELADDVAAAGTDGFADADLARPLGHADQHDVHDADA